MKHFYLTKKKKVEKREIEKEIKGEFNLVLK